MNNTSLPFCTYTLPFFSTSCLDYIRANPEIRVEQESQPKLLVHQIQRCSVGVNVPTILEQQKVMVSSQKPGTTKFQMHLDTNSIEESLMYSAYPRDFPYGQVMHKRFDRVAVEGKMKLSVRLVLWWDTEHGVLPRS